MAKKREFTRNYAMSDPELMQLGDKAVSLINRDAAELLTYGIDAAVRNLIAAKTEDFKNFPSDVELEGAISTVVEDKNALADNLKMAVRSIMVRVRNVFGISSAEYRRFNSKDMDGMNDNELYRLGKRVKKMATLYLAQLASAGLMQTHIDELATLTLAFDDSIDEKDMAVKERDIAKEDRIKLGNELYAQIVMVFNAGRDYWFSRNEAKHNDFVIYGTFVKKEKETKKAEG